MAPAKLPTLRSTLLASTRLQTRSIQTTNPFHASKKNSQKPQGVPDALEKDSAKGKTGGGEPLSSSSENAPPQPKISNLSVPGVNGREKLTEEQKKEVDEHNREFEEKHDHGNDAEADKVDKKFWSEKHERG